MVEMLMEARLRANTRMYLLPTPNYREATSSKLNLDNETDTEETPQ